MKEQENQLHEKIFEIVNTKYYGYDSKEIENKRITDLIVQLLKKDQRLYFPLEPDLSDESECVEMKKKVLDYAKQFEQKHGCQIYHIFLRSKFNFFFNVMYTIPKEVAMNEKIYEDVGEDTTFEIVFLPFGKSLNPLAIKYDNFYKYVDGKWTNDFPLHP